jgi:hypothetical protein
MKFAPLGLGVSERCLARQIRVEIFPAGQAAQFRHKNALVAASRQG